MGRIYKRTDRVEVKIDDVTLKIAPLTIDQKTEIQTLMTGIHKGMSIKDASRGICLAIKYGLKEVKGIKDSDNNEYKLQLDDNGNLTETCLDDLMNLDSVERLMRVCAEFVKGVPTGFTDDKGNPLTGVELVDTAKATEPKNA